MKVKLLFGENIIDSNWQEKSFADEYAAINFIRKHRNRIHGINKTIQAARFMSHFDIIDALREV